MERRPSAELEGPDGEAVRRAPVEAAFLPTDDADRKRWIVETMCAVPLSVAAAAIHGVVGWNGIAALAMCTVPLLVLRHGQEEATNPLGCFRSSPISTLV